jgi:hypothetical protein
MTETQLLAGSLSNDLFRIASLAQRGSTQAASRFLREAKRWSVPLQFGAASAYIKDIAEDISNREVSDISMASAEKYLMYGVLLQNYTLHNK